MKKAITYGLYPFLLLSVLTVIILSIRLKWDYGQVYGLTTLGLIVILLLTESIYPLKREWKMTGKSFWRDLRYYFFDAPVIIVAKIGFGWLAIRLARSYEGIFSTAPIILAVIGYLLVFEFFQYWYHRISHRGQGRHGAILWRIHVAHHLPDKVYVLMHGVFHPVNTFITTFIIQVPLLLLGVPPGAALAATLLIDLQSLVSHFNTDIRAGWLNYIFIGTETHRYHHSANMDEAKNYGNTLAIWDIVFGTFFYQPKKLPKQLGVADAQDYPASNKIWQVMMLPFRAERNDKADRLVIAEKEAV